MCPCVTWSVLPGILSNDPTTGSLVCMFMVGLHPLHVQAAAESACCIRAGWSNQETVMQWTLGRVYLLKMANLCVLLLQLEKLGQKEDQCVSFEVCLAQSRGMVQALLSVSV